MTSKTCIGKILTTKTLLTSAYVDDMFVGSEDFETTKQLQIQPIQLMPRGGMQHHKFLVVLHSPSNHDCFRFSVEVDFKDNYTKRDAITNDKNLHACCCKNLIDLTLFPPPIRFKCLALFFKQPICIFKLCRFQDVIIANAITIDLHAS